MNIDFFRYQSIFIFLINIIVIPYAFCSENMLGVWINSSVNNKKIFVFDFQKNNRFELNIKKIDGKISKHYGEYFINKEKVPNTIDLKNITNHTGPLFGIIKTIDNNSILISEFSKKWKLRPISFRKNNSRIFKKLIKEE